jgi:uncharacterized membrane protein
MWITISLIVFYLLAPAFLIYLTKISKFLNRLGAVVLAYLLGLIVGNIGILPAASNEFRTLLGTRMHIPKPEFLEYLNNSQLPESDVLVNQVASTQDILFTIIIPLAIPLLLFSLDIRKWLKLAKGAILSLVLAVFSLLVVIFTGYYFFGSSIDDSNKVAGMLVGVYTGGTPNLAAIGNALKVNPNIFILTHTYDLIAGSVALIFLMTIAQRVFHIFLPKFQVVYKAENKLQLADESEDIENYDPLFKEKQFPMC